MPTLTTRFVVEPCDDDVNRRTWDLFQVTGRTRECVAQCIRTQREARALARRYNQPPKLLHRFVDPTTMHPLSEHEYTDVHGTDLTGSDEHGLWWGTERAAWVLSEGGTFVCVSGYCYGQPYQGYFIGSEAEALNFAVHRAVRDATVHVM